MVTLGVLIIFGVIIGVTKGKGIISSDQVMAIFLVCGAGLIYIGIMKHWARTAKIRQKDVGECIPLADCKGCDTRWLCYSVVFGAMGFVVSMSALVIWAILFRLT